MSNKLTKEQLSQQDFVDNTIFDMLKTLLPDLGDDEPKWDIEILAEIRDVIVDHYELDLMKFYPYLKNTDE
jgi:hypothetical protein